MHSRSTASTVSTGTQNLVPEEAGISDQQLMKRKRVASNATNRKVPRKTDKLSRMSVWRVTRVCYSVAQTALIVINLINLYIMCGEYEMLNDAWKYNIE